MENMLTLGFSTTLLGMGVTFSGLIFLWISIIVMGKFVK